MTPLDDDHAIRAALLDLADGQPPPPHDRFQAVRRRAIRRRWRQLSGVVTTVAAAAGLIVGLLRLPAPQPQVQPQPQAARAVPGWALAWPDHRNGSVPQSVLDLAVLTWLYSAPNSPPDGGKGTVPAPGSSAREVARQAGRYPVVWYVGQTIDHGYRVVVMFEVAGPTGPELVVGQATANQVMQNQPAWSDAISPWVLTSVPAPDPDRPPAAIGEYAAQERSLPRGQMPDNLMVVLTAPSVLRVTWRAATTSGPAMRTDSTTNGLVITDTGQVTAPVELTALRTARGNLLAQPVLVGVPGDNAAPASGGGPTVPYLAAPPAVSEPSTFHLRDGLSGQGTSGVDTITYGRAPYTVLGVCYGPQPLVIQIDGQTIGTIACDSLTHQLSVPPSLAQRHTMEFLAHTSNLTAWRAEIGTLG
jgi:hypothetical protein